MLGSTLNTGVVFLSLRLGSRENMKSAPLLLVTVRMDGYRPAYP